jgi:hypothetical protein
MSSLDSDDRPDLVKSIDEMVKPPLYLGVFLDDHSHGRLLKWWKRETGTDVLSKVYAHHMTIKFKPNQSDMRRHKMSEEVDLQVVGWADNGKVQAVVVTGYESANKVAHITVATDGTPPKFSNDLVEAGYTRVRGPKLSGKIEGFYPGKR